jgi:transposase-like protein
MKKLNGSELRSTAKLTARQEQAIQALLTGANVKEAAQYVQVGRTTLYRWLQEPAFCNAYQAAQERSHTWTVNRLQHMAAKAIQVLEQILDDAEVPALAKVEAARAVLDCALGKDNVSQRGTQAPAKSELSLSPVYLEPNLHEGKVAAVLEHTTHHKPSAASLHSP